MNREFLNPGRRLVDEVVGWLCGNERFAGHVRTDGGAPSLAHVMVVVPTAQSGRNLRLALAKEAARRGWGGILPPKVVQPMSLVRPADEALREATATEAAATFQQYVKAHRMETLALDALVRPEEFDDLTARFALFDQLQDIWRTLAGRGLLMGDVAGLAREMLAADFGDELKRWEQLGKLEAGYFAYLHELGLRYPTESVHAARTRAALVEDAVEEIVVPALADPIRVVEDVLAQQVAAGKTLTVLLHVAPSEADRFNDWGCPRTERWTGAARPVLERLADADIVSAPNASALAKRVAADFPPADGDAALPSLGLCDGDLYEGLSAAFLNRQYVVHNPERHRLAGSSLGRMAKDLMALYAADEWPWQEFVSFFRSDDVLLALGLSGKARVKALAGLDVAQNAYIPTVLPKDFAFPHDPDMRDFNREKLAAFCERARALGDVLGAARRGVSLVAFLRKALAWVFAERPVPSGKSGKEFQAAAEAMRKFLAALEGPVVQSLEMTAPEFAALARRELDAAVYSLEPDGADVIRTEGWLELAWSAADRIALAGLHEGKVPDSIVGHPFLPDALRKALGLVTNEDRLARDTWLFAELLASHAPHAVRAYVARASDDGDICRPSRLLYLCADDALAARIGGLFGDIPEERSDKVRRVDWAMRLPDEIAPADHYSPSALDAYVKCPFTYLLQNGLRMEPYADKEELEANDFGTLVHAALKAYADLQIARGDDQLTDAREIRRLFAEEICPAVRAKYGRTTLNIDLQLRALEGRLALFADVQAAWAQQGWRIRMAEREIPKDLDIPCLGFRIHGYIDRVDENIEQRSEVRGQRSDSGIPPLSNSNSPWCVIDYKTWDKATLSGRVFTTGTASEKNRAHAAFAEAMGYPVFFTGKKQTTPHRVLSVQLPIYGKCLAALEPSIPFAAVQYAYLVLGASADQCAVLPLKSETVEPALATARRAAELIGRNLFWPPGPTDEWKWNLAGLFVTDPLSDLGESDWAKRQEAKRGECHD